MQNLIMLILCSVICSVVLLAQNSYASPSDVTDLLTSATCTIPSDDQNGVVLIKVISRRPPHRLIFELRFSQNAKWKLLDYPVNLVTFDPTDGSYQIVFPMRGGYETSALVTTKMTGQFKTQQPARPCSCRSRTACSSSVQVL